ncbi:MAG: hypothetical protein PWP64_753 [Candidatus Cloacimonadota bacterium]|nr:hypothetical protein [Candidatus Cloacimonadota bacterium]
MRYALSVMRYARSEGLSQISRIAQIFFMLRGLCVMRYALSVIRYPLSVMRYALCAQRGSLTDFTDCTDFFFMLRGLCVMRYPLSVTRYALSVIRYPRVPSELIGYRQSIVMPSKMASFRNSGLPSLDLGSIFVRFARFVVNLM